MPDYTKGAEIAIRTLQKLEGNEFIDIGKALLALSDLSPIDSYLAQALRRVWNDSSRDQYRAALSGRPGTEHLRLNMPTGYGFRLQILLGEAGQFATKEGTQQAGERHIAATLVKISSNMLGPFGINGEQLVAEVTRLEMGPQEGRLKKGLELERLRFGHAWDDVHRTAVAEASKVSPDSTRMGLLRLAENALRERVGKRVEIRSEIMRDFPELGSAKNLDVLCAEIESLVDSQQEPIISDIARSGGVVEREDVQRLNRRLTESAFQVKAWGRQKLEIVRREADLGIQRIERPSIVNINISGSTVAGLNLGTVIGDFQTAYVTLQDTGNADLANQLKGVIDAVGQASELGDRRRDVIQSLVTIGEQATLPEPERRPGLVRSLLPFIEKTIGVGANLSQLWSTLAPIIMNHFRLS